MIPSGFQMREQPVSYGGYDIISIDGVSKKMISPINHQQSVFWIAPDAHVFLNLIWFDHLVAFCLNKVNRTRELSGPAYGVQLTDFVNISGADARSHVIKMASRLVIGEIRIGCKAVPDYLRICDRCP